MNKNGHQHLQQVRICLHDESIKEEIDNIWLLANNIYFITHSSNNMLATLSFTNYYKNVYNLKKEFQSSLINYEVHIMLLGRFRRIMKA